MLNSKWVWFCKKCKYLYESEPEENVCKECGSKLKDRTKNIINKGVVNYGSK